MIEFGKLETAELTKEQALQKKDKELRQACAAFEGMFMDMMMKNMRKATMESDLIKKSNGEKVFTEMLDQQYVDVMAKNGTGGLGLSLYEHLKSTMPEYRDLNPNYARKSSDFNALGRENSVELKPLENETQMKFAPLNRYEIERSRVEEMKQNSINLMK